MYDGELVALPDGTIIGRRMGRRSGTPIIDIRYPGDRRWTRVQVVSTDEQEPAELAGVADEEPSGLAVALLWDCLADEGFLASIDGVGWTVGATHDEVKRLVLDATSWLLDRDLIRLFSVEAIRPGEQPTVVPWDEPTAAQLIARLDAVYTNDDEDWLRWGFTCWFGVTPAGDAVARRHPPEKPRDA